MVPAVVATGLSAETEILGPDVPIMRLDPRGSQRVLPARVSAGDGHVDAPGGD
jgi:hypothetical protein